MNEGQRRDFKEIIVNAVIGKGFLGIEDSAKMEKIGLAKFDGDQHNQRWKWDKAALEKLSLEMLCNLYDRKGGRQMIEVFVGGEKREYAETREGCEEAFRDFKANYDEWEIVEVRVGGKRYFVDKRKERWYGMNWRYLVALFLVLGWVIFGIVRLIGGGK
jgi:hypothetical protein